MHEAGFRSTLCARVFLHTCLAAVYNLYPVLTGLRVDDIVRSGAVVADMRKIIRQDPRIIQKLHRRVFLDKITRDQVSIYISCYVEAPNRDAFMAVKQDLLLAFIDCVERNGAKLARNRLQVAFTHLHSQYHTGFCCKCCYCVITVLLFALKPVHELAGLPVAVIYPCCVLVLLLMSVSGSGLALRQSRHACCMMCCATNRVQRSAMQPLHGKVAVHLSLNP